MTWTKAATITTVVGAIVAGISAAATAAFVTRNEWHAQAGKDRDEIRVKFDEHLRDYETLNRDAQVTRASFQVTLNQLREQMDEQTQALREVAREVQGVKLEMARSRRGQ